MTDFAAQSAQAAPLDHAAIRTIVIGIMLAMFLSALDQTVVATALPTIGRSLGEVDTLSWVVTAYLLSSTAATPLYGKLSDIHGRRTMLLIGIAIFIVGSVACALAPTMAALIAARFLQGLGGGGLISLAQTIIADVIPPRERGRYQAYIAAVFMASSVGGPVIGGVFAEHLHWSLIFWINLPLGLAALAMTYTVLRRLPQHQRRHDLDVLGAGLMVVAAVLLLLALTWGGARYPWGSPLIVGLLAGSAAFWILFALRIATAPEPFLPLSILRNPVVGAAVASAFFAMGTLIGLTIQVPLYFEVVLGLSASQSGLALIPLMGGVVIGATGAGRVMQTVRRYKRLPVAGLLIAIAGLATIAVWPASLPHAATASALAVIGLGLGTVLPVTTVSMQNAVPPHELGTTTGLMGFFRALGGAIIVAGYAAILVAAAGDALFAGGEAAHAFRLVFIAAAAGLAVALLFLLAMEEKPLRGRTPSAAPAPAE